MSAISPFSIVSFDTDHALRHATFRQRHVSRVRQLDRRLERTSRPRRRR